MLVRRMKFLLSPSPVLNISADSTPFNDVSRCVSQRMSTEEEPAILAIVTPQSCFHFTRIARSENGMPAFQQLRQVFRMNDSLPPTTTGFVKVKARVFAPPLVQEVDVPVRQRSPY